jgi:hypothetical protein
MAFSLVEGVPKDDTLEDLRAKLTDDAFADLRPVGPTISRSLCNARRRLHGTVVGEEEDDCLPPPAQEREAILDRYFRSIEVDPVAEGDGWVPIEDLPPAFPALADETQT